MLASHAIASSSQIDSDGLNKSVDEIDILLLGLLPRFSNQLLACIPFPAVVKLFTGMSVRVGKVCGVGGLLW